MILEQSARHNTKRRRLSRGRIMRRKSEAAILARDAKAANHEKRSAAQTARRQREWAMELVEQAIGGFEDLQIGSALAGPTRRLGA